MAFKLKNPLKSPLKQNHDWFQQLPNRDEPGGYGFAYGQELSLIHISEPTRPY